MNNTTDLQTKRFGALEAQVFPDKQALGEAAANRAAAIIKETLERKPSARVIFATGKSQDEVIGALTANRSVDWSRVLAFHMDEYVGISMDHPASFRHWLKTRVVDVVQLQAAHYLNGDSADLQQECQRYGALLREAPVDLCMLGIGENGHIAFNDPHVADFEDPLPVKPVTLDLACRKQQVGEGHFPSIDAVPSEALTLTCPTLMACLNLICCVPDDRKANAVKGALEGPIETACPASLLRRHPQARLYLDRFSASLLKIA